MSEDLPLPGLEVEGELGRGAFGRVLAVRRTRDGAALALKLLEDQDMARIQRELAAYRRVDHPHVIRCLDSGTHEGVGFLLMERAEGTLERRIRDPARFTEVWARLHEAGRGLAALHAAGLVHRDVKPSNVLLGPRGAMLADLGLAKGGDLQTLTQEGWVLGTPAYMAPEQVLGRPVTHASDLYSLALCFWEALEGRLPFPDDLPPGDLLHQVASAAIAPGPRATSLLGEEARAALGRALRPAPEERPDAIEPWLATLGAEAPGAKDVAPEAGPEVTRSVLGPGVADTEASTPASPLAAVPAGPSAPPRRRHLAAGLAVLAALLLGAAGLWSPARPPPPTTGTSAPEGAPTPASPLGPRYRERLLREVEVLSILDQDPASWYRIHPRLPTFRRFRDWVAAGGDPLDLPVATRAEMAAADDDLAALGLPRAHEPFLEARPAAEPFAPGQVLQDMMTIQGYSDSLAGTFRGWAAAALRALSTARARRFDRDQQLLGLLPPGDPPPPRGPAGLDLLRFDALPPSEVVRRAGNVGQTLFALRSARLELSAFYAEARRPFRIGVRAALRALEEAPRESAAVTLLAVTAIHHSPTLFFSPLADPDLTATYGVVPDTPGGNWIAAQIHRQLRRAFQSLPDRAPEIEARMRRHAWAALEARLPDVAASHLAEYADQYRLLYCVSILLDAVEESPLELLETWRRLGRPLEVALPGVRANVVRSFLTRIATLRDGGLDVAALFGDLEPATRELLRDPRLDAPSRRRLAEDLERAEPSSR